MQNRYKMPDAYTGTDVLKVPNARCMGRPARQVIELAGLGCSVLLVRACTIMPS